MYLTNTNTICAIATPPGIGAISMIRISGNETLETLKRLQREKNFLLEKLITVRFFLIVESY